ncbi:alpha/beta hydrolase [Chryseobacterium sp. PBS4-4]|uniref:Alpha/beta hydrolase n=1 Tax=Chryseobacterium edaphi TaxID=2976532 RepID=A0ABT2W6I7_9FLAO|nr:alpha/beta hydrolase [Chryseobacterium edaphi]MCU7616325.1 alpha/beta hydrolase [Chryseobacterium edaphi]
MKLLKSIIAFAILFLAVNVNAQNKDNSKKPTIIFVHGLFADGSSWSEVIPTLLATGYDVISVQNPTNSLAEDVAFTKRAIDRAAGPVILIGHSWGGFVITEAGNDPKVKGLVYVAALAPDKGETLPGLSATAPATELGKYFAQSNGYMTLTREGVQKVFAEDLSPSQQDVVYATQNAANGKVFADTVTEAAWKTKPSWFVVAKSDKSLHPDLQRFFVKRMKAKSIEVDASHVVMISKPKEVLKLILEAANSK